MTPSAWKYEYASSVSEDGYTNWQTGISATKPNGPAGSTRNVTPLYALRDGMDAFELVSLADALRTAQREYMANRGSDTKGAAVAEAARRYDTERVKYK